MKKIKLLSLAPITIFLISACSFWSGVSDSQTAQVPTETTAQTPTITSSPTETITPSPIYMTISTDTLMPTLTPEPSAIPDLENTPNIDSQTICYGGGDTAIYLVTGKRTEDIYISWVDSELTYWQELRRIPFCQRFASFPSGARLFLEAKYQDLRDESEITCQIFYKGEKVAEDTAIASENRMVTCSVPLE